VIFFHFSFPATKYRMDFSFRVWLEAAGRPGGKTMLYPLGYGGIGLYPPQDSLTHAADAILYVTEDPRLKYLGVEGHPHSIKHIPGGPSTEKNGYITHPPGEGEPFAINHLPGKPTYTYQKPAN
jgi:hypothetical protein